jgi:hypothetical protein
MTNFSGSRSIDLPMIIFGQISESLLLGSLPEFPGKYEFCPSTPSSGELGQTGDARLKPEWHLATLNERRLRAGSLNGVIHPGTRLRPNEWQVHLRKLRKPSTTTAD